MPASRPSRALNYRRVRTYAGTGTKLYLPTIEPGQRRSSELKAPVQDAAEARIAVFELIEAFYNPRGSSSSRLRPGGVGPHGGIIGDAGVVAAFDCLPHRLD